MGRIILLENTDFLLSSSYMCFFGAMHAPSTLYTVKKRLSIFPSPAGMSLTKLSLAGYNLIITGIGW
jgi:hypothetical protein